MRRWYSRVRRSCSWRARRRRRRGSRCPRSAASSSVPGLVTVTHIGGWGFCTGFGSTGRSGIEKRSPRRTRTRSCGPHAGASRARTRPSAFFVVSGSAPKPPSSVQVEARAVPNSSRPPERMSRTAARSATRIGWFICGHTDDGPMADADPLGLHRHRGEEELGRRAVRILLEEVVLDRPDACRSRARRRAGPARARCRYTAAPLAARERPGHGQLEEDPELHVLAVCHGAPHRLGHLNRPRLGASR